MLNPFIIKRWIATTLSGFFPTLSFAICTVFYSYWIGLASFFITFIIMFFLTKILLSNPFTDMLEGKGLLVISIDSTGIIKPFLIGLKQPYVTGSLDGEKVRDVYDRNTVYQLAAAAKNCGKQEKTKDGKVIITLDDEKFNKSRFGMYQYPVLLYNKQVKSLITKDFLSEQEKESFAEHGILYLNKKMEELTSVVRDFGRYVVELTKPKEEFWKNKWLWFFLIGGIILLALLLGKPVIEQFMSLGKGVGGAVSNVASSPVIPR